MSWHLVTSVPTTFQNHSPSWIQGPAGSEDLWIPAELWEISFPHLCSFQDSNICRKMPKPQNSAPRIIAGRRNALSPPWETKRKIRRTRTRTTCGKWDKTKYIHTHELFQTHGYHHSDGNAGLFPEFAVKHSKAGAELCSPKQARTSVALRPGIAICAAALNNPSFCFVRCIN